MKFGFVNTLENPDQAIAYDQLLDNLRAQAKVCDQGGFDSFWFAEHHFGVNGRDASPNPFMLATDIASRTERIRMGLAVVILPLWHPLRAAENIALLDQMTKGRLEVGFGRASQPHEVVTFNPDADPRVPEGSRAVFAEALDVVTKALTEEFFEHEGDYFHFPKPGISWSSRTGFDDDERWIKDGEVYRLAVVPRTYQKPHPPFWMALSSEGSAQIAGLLALKPIAWRQTARRLKEWIGLYQNGCEQRGAPDPDPGKSWGVLRNVFVAPTMEEARRIYAPYVEQMFRYRAADPWRALQAFLDPGEEPNSGMGLNWDFLLKRVIIAGSPQNVIEQIQELEEITGIGTILASTAHEGLPQEHILSSLELLGEHVVPEVAKFSTKTAG